MENINIQALLEKYRAGTISPEELALLETWYLQWEPEHPEISHWELLAVKDEVWQAVKPQPAKRITFLSRPRIAAAASLLLLLAVSAYYLLHKPSPQQVPAQAAVNDANDGPKPGGNKAVLTLSNGRQLVLTDVKNGKLADQGAVSVSKAGDGQLVYGKNGRTAGETAYNTMATPRGGQYHITLADGTQVWLNAASSITYPVAFTGNERKVTISGEVYFEVAGNENKPFKVSTGNQEVTVLGTHFNVKGYADDAGISTTLLSGSIRVSNLTSGRSSLLKPGQQAEIFPDQAAIQVKTVNTENVISWKNGYFLFDNQDIESIMKIMSRWYDVDVAYHYTRRQERFGGTFSRASDLSEILHNLEQVGHVHFNMQAKRITVTD